MQGIQILGTFEKEKILSPTAHILTGEAGIIDSISSCILTIPSHLNITLACITLLKLDLEHITKNLKHNISELFPELKTRIKPGEENKGVSIQYKIPHRSRKQYEPEFRNLTIYQKQIDFDCLN